MRYVEGDDLKTLIAREAPLDPDRALRLIEQVGDALDAAHDKGSSIATSSPATSSRRRDGREHAYLSDFGLSSSRPRSPG